MSLNPRTPSVRGNWKPGPIVGEPGPTLLDTTLTPGQVLYIPRGFGHSAVGAQGLSAHLSLTVREIGGRELVRAVTKLLFEGTTVPPRPLDDESLYAAGAELLEAARDRLDSLGPEHVVGQAREALRGQKFNNSDTDAVARLAARLAELPESPN